MIMYQTHCQRVLDTVVRANFEEVSCGNYTVAIETVKMPFLNKDIPYMESQEKVKRVPLFLRYKISSFTFGKECPHTCYPSSAVRLPSTLSPSVTASSTELVNYSKLIRILIHVCHVLVVMFYVLM